MPGRARWYEKADASYWGFEAVTSTRTSRNGLVYIRASHAFRAISTSRGGFPAEAHTQVDDIGSLL